MKNPKNQGKQTPAQPAPQPQQPQLPEGFSRESIKTIGVIAILVLVFMNFSVVTDLMMNIMIVIYGLVGRNFGIAIILFTVLIRILTWPLNAQQMQSAKAMQEFQNDKEWQAVQKKYAKDKEKMNMEMMRLQRERGINMFGSCLPTLIQLPILFALIPSITYAIGSAPLSLLKLSRSLYDFQNASALIPLNSKFLWMDLGLPERSDLLGLGLSIPILALIVGLTTYVQTKLTMPPSTNPNDQAAATNKMMVVYMPVMLFFFSVNYASGLAVYFITSNILAIVQYAMMGRVNWRNLLPGGQNKTA
jgi:YidC/Oxa1 family membrane protein insertase